MAPVEMEDTIELDRERKLFLKSIARMMILVQLPDLKVPGTSISNWEVMEKLKRAISPNLFSYLKVTKTTMECIYFEAEADSKELLSKFISNLDGKTIKLSGFSEAFKVKAGKAKVKFPKKHDWVAFFRDSKNMDESKPGERPDTMHIKGLPIKWFLGVDRLNHEKPCEKTIYEIFERFGKIRKIDIPMLDAYRNRMNIEQIHDTQVFKTFSFGTNLYFEIYIQYADYTGFEKVMQTFKGKKLVHLLEDDKTAAVNIEVDFDKTAFLGEKNIKRREIERQKLIKYDIEQKEKARKIQEQEEFEKEIERLIELKREEERIREIEEEKRKKEFERKIREQKKKLHRIRKRILYHEKKRQAKINDKKRKEMILLREKQGKQLVKAILKSISMKKEEEKREEKRRSRELRILKQLEAKKLKKEDEIREKNKIEDEKKEKLETHEKKLRQKLLKSLKEIEENNEEEKRELLRYQLANKNSKISSVVCKNTSLDS